MMANEQINQDTPLRIAILAHNLRSGGGISVGRNILSSLGRLASKNHYLVTIPPDLGYEEITAGMANSQQIVFRGGGNYLQRWLFDNCRLPKIVKSWRPDVVLGLGNMGLHGNRDIPQAILCHCPFLLYDKRHYGRSYGWINLFVQRLFKRPRFAKDIDNSSVVFCQTRTAGNRIRQVYGFRGECRLLPNAVSSFTQSGEADAAVPDILQQHADKFRLFYLTRYYSHKNIETLLEVFERYENELSNCVLFLSIAEEHGRAAAHVLRDIDRKGLQDHIVNIGPIAQESLRAYFHNVDAMLMPTLLESFSGSYLEAMHFGVPILTSDLDFAHEVCGEAALYFDPWDVESIKRAILKLKNDPQLAAKLISSGTRQLQASHPSWDEITKQLLINLREIAVRK